ncbi:hypothetical protein WJX81_006086 [Elliptochloris bilobata]|uniref:Methyltransferase type 11 domain-containing protein n=1 Tax=Elliptochloris bilobata TaxID=381761 RepID=A0AAW1QNI4_9CHLO
MLQRIEAKEADLDAVLSQRHQAHEELKAATVSAAVAEQRILVAAHEERLHAAILSSKATRGTLTQQAAELSQLRKTVVEGEAAHHHCAFEVRSLVEQLSTRQAELDRARDELAAAQQHTADMLSSKQELAATLQRSTAMIPAPQLSGAQRLWGHCAAHAHADPCQQTLWLASPAARAKEVPAPGITELDAGQVSLPLLEVFVVLGGWFAARLAIGFRLTYVTAAMLSRTIPKGARVLQLGGDVTQLYYYPADTILVSVAAPKLNKGLWEQAGIQAGVPVHTQQTEELADLSFQANESIDAVVSSGMLSGLAAGAQKQLAASAARVLKPGGVFVFIERGDFGGDRQALEAVLSLPQFEDATYDIALAGVDAHAVGLAHKSSAQSAGRGRDRSKTAPIGHRRAPKGFA